MAKGTPIEVIVDAYARFGHEGLAAEAVGLKRGTVRERLKKAALISDRRPSWIAREDAVIRRCYPRWFKAQQGEGVVELARRMDRKPGDVIDRAFRIGVTRHVEGRDLLGDELMEYEWGVGLAGFGVIETVVSEVRRPVDGLDLFRVMVEGDPLAKQRPRLGKGGHFHTPQKVINAEQVLSLRLATLPFRFTGNLCLSMLIALGTARLSDKDNLEKLVMDAVNDSGVWRDDAQVTMAITRLTIDRDRPRTEITFAPYDDPSIPRGTLHWPSCAFCRESFNPGARKRPPRTCSPECEAGLGFDAFSPDGRVPELLGGAA